MSQVPITNPVQDSGDLVELLRKLQEDSFQFKSGPCTHIV